MKYLSFFFIALCAVFSSCKKDTPESSGIYFNVSSASPYTAVVEITLPAGGQQVGITPSENYIGTYNYSKPYTNKNDKIHVEIVCEKGQIIDYIFKIKGKKMEPTDKFVDLTSGKYIIDWYLTSP